MYVIGCKQDGISEGANCATAFVMKAEAFFESLH